MHQYKGSFNAYIINYVLTVVIFGTTNVIDYFAGHSDYSKSYPLSLFLLWTSIVSTFLFLGWIFVYILNALPLYTLAIYAMFNHMPNEDPTTMEWLIGTLPLQTKYLIFIPIIFLLSLILQFVFHRIKLARNEEVEYIEEEEEEDNY
jgi:hypothetical protein